MGANTYAFVFIVQNETRFWQSYNKIFQTTFLAKFRL